MMLQMMLDVCWHGTIWLDADVDTIYIERISLNGP
jgi:hypothetical protein